MWNVAFVWDFIPFFFVVVQHIFLLEQEEYKNEGIDWSNIPFVNNEPLLVRWDKTDSFLDDLIWFNLIYFLFIILSFCFTFFILSFCLYLCGFVL